MQALARVQAKIEAGARLVAGPARIRSARTARAGRGSCVRSPVRRHEAARAAGARAGVGARPAAARRAHQPSRHRGDRLAGGIPEGLGRRAGVRHARPPLPARAGDAHRRDRSRPGHQLAGRLGQLPAPPRGTAQRRGAGAARFDKLLAQEETWIRQGIKARRTRDEGRVRRLEAMRRERAARREQVGNVRMETAQVGGVRQEGDRSARRVVRARRPGASCAISTPRSCAATASA